MRVEGVAVFSRSRMAFEAGDRCKSAEASWLFWAVRAHAIRDKEG